MPLLTGRGITWCFPGIAGGAINRRMAIHESKQSPASKYHYGTNLNPYLSKADPYPIGGNGRLMVLSSSRPP